MTRLQLKDPASPDDIVATIGEPEPGEEIPNADKLGPVEDLSDVFSEHPAKGAVHLVVQLPAQREQQAKVVTSGLSASLDVAAGRVEYLKNNKPAAPSSAGQSNAFAERQEKPNMRIECNRPPSTAPPTPPTLLHRVFGEFLDMCASGNVGAEDHDLALNLSRAMSLFYETELSRAQTIRDLFERYGLFFKCTEISNQTYTTDGSIFLNQFQYALLEVKNEIGRKGAKPYAQAALYYLESNRPRAAKWAHSVLPCLVVVVFGPS